MTIPTRDTPTPTDSAPSLRVVAAACFLAGLIGAVLVALYALAPNPRPGLLNLLNSAAPYFAVLIPSGFGWVLHTKLKTNTAITAKIDQQTNGVLDRRITAGVGRALMAAGLVQEHSSLYSAAVGDSSPDGIAGAAAVTAAAAAAAVVPQQSTDTATAGPAVPVTGTAGLTAADIAGPPDPLGPVTLATGATAPTVPAVS